MNTDLTKLLEDVKAGRVSVEEATLQLKKEPFADIDFAKVDLHRKYRQGAEEVIYGAGKTAKQIQKIAETMLANGCSGILITRLSEENSAKLSFPESVGYAYYKDAKVAIVGKKISAALLMILSVLPAKIEHRMIPTKRLSVCGVISDLKWGKYKWILAVLK